MAAVLTVSYILNNCVPIVHCTLLQVSLLVVQSQLTCQFCSLIVMKKWTSWVQYKYKGQLTFSNT